MENSCRERDAMDGKRGELGPGEGAGVGGEAIGMNNIGEALPAIPGDVEDSVSKLSAFNIEIETDVWNLTGPSHVEGEEAADKL
jgi:hypothetical protein